MASKAFSESLDDLESLIDILPYKYDTADKLISEKLCSMIRALRYETISLLATTCLTPAQT